MSAQFKNLADLCEKSVARFPKNPLFGTRRGDGTWDYITFQQFGDLVNQFRGGLASLGIGKGDRVAVISDNRIEWAVGAYATYGLAACYVPMYEKQNSADWEYIIRDSEAKLLLVPNAKVAGITKPWVGKLGKLAAIVDFSGPESDPTSYAALLKKGAAAPAVRQDPESSELCGFIYTSGTTGNPKGVKLSHGNITSNVNAVQSIFPMNEGDRSLSFLPWAHSFGQTCELHCGISFGMSMAIVDDVNRLVEYLSEVKPTLLFSVPRIFNRIYDRLNKQIADAPAVRRALFNSAMDTARERRKLRSAGQSSGWVNLKHGFFDKLVFSKVRARLGGNLRYAFSGGAAISKEVAEFIDNVGITVYEGYGLSETSPIATANYPENQKIGSVGKAIPGVEILIDEGAVGGALGKEGEIVIKGPNVMQGYHNLDDETKAVLRGDGGFRTGDLGWKDEQGYVYITGRIKEQYKLENGKYVVPAPLEEQLKLSGYITHAMVFGANKPHNVAVLVPDFEALDKWAKSNALEGGRTAWLDHPKVRALYQEELDRYQQDVFKSFEKCGDFRLVEEDWTTDNDLLTPTLKLKRRNVIKKYQPLIDAMYEGATQGAA